MPQVSRRAVVTFGVGAVGLAAAAIAATPAIAMSAQNVGGIPVRSRFAAELGKRFVATSAGSSFTVTLDAIHDLVPSTTPDDEHRFNLVFGSTHASFGEGIVELRRAGFPTTSLFISPIGPAAKTQALQAIVNRSA